MEYTINGLCLFQLYTYDAWGKVTVHDGYGHELPGTPPFSRFLLFTGRDYDADTGLYHYRSRAYSPKIRRFLQPDRIDFYGGDLNLYRYVENNPICWIDPWGLQTSNSGIPNGYSQLGSFLGDGMTAGIDSNTLVQGMNRDPMMELHGRQAVTTMACAAVVATTSLVGAEVGPLALKCVLTGSSGSDGRYTSGARCGRLCQLEILR